MLIERIERLIERLNDTAASIVCREKVLIVSRAREETQFQLWTKKEKESKKERCT
jgi:hypothetical protein